MTRWMKPAYSSAETFAANSHRHGSEMSVATAIALIKSSFEGKKSAENADVEAVTWRAIAWLFSLAAANFFLDCSARIL